jgi:putative membrane protein
VQNREIRRFAQQMIDDHTKAGSMMREVAAREGINLPQTPELSPKHVEMARNVEGAGSGQFDRIYMDAQVAAHQETVELFRDYAQSGDNANIRDFAQTILPTLENHLTEAQNLRCAQVGAAD